MGSTLERLGQPAAAQAQFEQARTLDPAFTHL